MFQFGDSDIAMQMFLLGLTGKEEKFKSKIMNEKKS